MAHTVFISYATPDLTLAQAACAALEQADIRCWMAPRDIPPGKPWPREIPAAIEASQVMVLIFTASADASDNILNEVSIAQTFGVPVLAFRAEALQPHGLIYYLNAIQWLTPEGQAPEQSLSALVSAVRAHLPAPPTPLTPGGGSGIPCSNAPKFIDRGAVMDALRQALRARTLTGVSGMGGLGKTEIAIQLANELEAEQPNSTLWITVAEKPPADVQAEIAFKLGLKFPADVSEAVRWDLLRAHLQAHPRAVFFDDVRKGFMGSLRRCLPPAPPCAVMITSRHSDLPGIPASAMHPLDVMNSDQALVLLSSVRGLEAPLQAEPEAAQRLIEACRRHPLALSLAANRLLKHLRDSSTPVADFTAPLTDRLEELRLDESDDPLRSLEANFYLSYAELEPLDQQRYRRLAVFAPSGFGLEGAAAVWGEPDLPAVRRALERFQDASLILPAESAGRWRLHDLLQEFAREHLEEAGELASTWQALETYLITLFQQHQSDIETAPQLPLELDNLQAAIQRLEPLRKPGANPQDAEHAENLAHFGSQYAEVIASRGLSYTDMGRFTEALADLDRALALDSTIPWFHAGRAHVLRRMHRLEESLAGFDRALALQPEFGHAIADRGVTLSLMNRNEEALAEYDRAIALDYAEDWVHASRGSALRQLNRLEEALASQNKALELTPDYPYALLERGRTLRALNRPAEALADLERALALDFKYPEVYAETGAALGETEQYEKSVEAFTEAIRLDPNYAWAWASRGETYRRLNQFELALSDLNQAIDTLQYRDALALTHRGQTLGQMGQHQAAWRNFDEAVQTDSQYYDAYFMRGLAAYNLGKAQQALADFTQYLEHYPKEASAQYYCINLRRRLGQFEAGLADTERVLALDSRLGALFVAARGIFHLRLRQSEAALADFEQAFALDAEPATYFMRGLAQAALGDHTSAAQSFRATLEGAREHLEAHLEEGDNAFNLALYLLADGDSERAEALYREHLEQVTLCPGDLHDVLCDLEDYLFVFPQSEAGQRMRSLLLQRLG